MRSEKESFRKFGAFRVAYTQGVPGCFQSAQVRVLIFLAALSAPAAAQLAPKATDYPAHAKARDIELGARYLPHGLPPGAAVSAGKDFLVVEVGVFPDSKSPVTLSKTQFTLNVDGKELPAVPPPDSPSASVTPAHDSDTRNKSAQLGGAPQFERARSSQEAETLPRRPISLRSDPATASDSARKTALPEGLTSKPVSGYLFFHFLGDPNSVRSVELVYTSSGTKTRVRVL
jgi:hypothetical protein